MAEKKKLFIHGGSSLISKYLIKRLCLEFNEIHIFCRDIKKTKSIIEVEDFKDLEFYFYENELENIDQTLNDIDKLPNDLSGVLWVSGYTGNPKLEFDFKELPKDDPRQRKPSIELAKNLLNWEPKIELKDGLLKKSTISPSLTL